jgi:sulfide:quinone oxidoreductase
MVALQSLTPDFAVAGQLAAADFAHLARQGFRSVISNRPDAEQPDQLSAAQSQALAEASGLQFAHLPVAVHDVLEPHVAEAARRAWATLPAPILAYCRSGTRAAIVWASAASATRPVAGVMEILAKAGFDIPEIADDLEARALETC